MKQRDIFLQSEGDAWHRRNKSSVFWDGHKTFIKNRLKGLGIEFKSALEIGCSCGALIDDITKAFGCTGYGIDPSKEAIRHGQETFEDIQFFHGTAESLPFGDDAFDLVIFGFCLYLCDIEDLHKIAAEADRVLQCGGILVIYDFYSAGVFRLSEYKHFEGVLTARLDWPTMFTWHPRYSLIHKETVFFKNTGDRIIEKRNVPASDLECLWIIKKGGS